MLSKARNSLSSEDAKKFDKIFVDQFFYVYAVTAKSRVDDNDNDDFMAKLQESLCSFKKCKAEVDAGPLSKVEKEKIKEKEKEKEKNPKVRHPQYQL